MRGAFFAVLITLFSRMVYATQATEDCQFALEGIRTIRGVFETHKELYDAVSETIGQMVGLAQEDAANNQELTSMKLLDLMGSSISRFRTMPGNSEDQVDPTRHAKIEAKMQDFASRPSSYDRLVNANAYIRYASPRQRYFSNILVAYAMIRTGLRSDQFLKVADLGAGYGDSAGALQSFLPRAHVVATDLSAPPLMYLKLTFPELYAVRHDYKTPLPFRDNSMDYLQSFASTSLFLNHEEFATTLGEIRRVLKPGGYHMFDVGPRTFEMRGPSISGVLKEVRAQGLEPEPKIGIRIEKEAGVFVYPILVRKPL